jgi:hypothetical protein
MFKKTSESDDFDSPQLVNRTTKSKNIFINCLNGYVKAFLHMPTIAKLIIGICILIRCYSLRDPLLFNKLENDPWAVIYYSELYRLSTAPYAFISTAQLILGIVLFAKEYTKYQKKWGVGVTTLDFLWKNLLINLTYIQVEIILYPKTSFDKYFVWGSYGLFGIDLMYIIDNCFESPRGQTKLPLTPFRISNIIYLFICFGLITFVNKGLRPVDVVALIVGFVHCKVIDPYFYELKMKLQWLLGGTSVGNTEKDPNESDDLTEDN